MEVTNQAPDTLEAETIAKIKAKHGVKEVYVLRVPLDDEGEEFAIGYLKKPSRQVIASVGGMAASDPVRANEVILKNCLIAEFSDMRILEDDDLFFSAGAALGDLIKFRKAELKKK